MQLTGKQIVKQGIIGNYCSEGIQQQGVDVRVHSIKKVLSGGSVPAEGKTTLPNYQEVNSVDGKYVLDPGYYEVLFKEYCSIPSNCVLNFKTRSSLVRCGAIIHSGQFDAGFHTGHMGAFLEVIRPLAIEEGARVAQAIVNESYEVEKEYLYDGQWQNI